MCINHQSGRQREQTARSYLEKSMEAWLLFLTPNNGLLAHFKKVDKGWVGLHQLFRLRKEKMRAGEKQKEKHLYRFRIQENV